MRGVGGVIPCNYRCTQTHKQVRKRASGPRSQANGSVQAEVGRGRGGVHASAGQLKSRTKLCSLLSRRRLALLVTLEFTPDTRKSGRDDTHPPLGSERASSPALGWSAV